MRNRLITGATDGIGLALARRWAARGERPLLHGRRALGSFPAAPVEEARYCRADLAEADGPAAVARFLDRVGVQELDQLVLNAGAGWFGSLDAQQEASIQELVAVNLWAPMALCHALLPRLRRARGRIAFVSSVVAALPCPQFAVYAATKAGLEGFARSLRIELEGQVEVQVLRPGATRTGMHEKSGATAAGLRTDGFPDAERVAGAIDRALDGPPRWRTLGARNGLARFAGRNLGGVVDRLQRSRA